MAKKKKGRKRVPPKPTTSGGGSQKARSKQPRHYQQSPEPEEESVGVLDLCDGDFSLLEKWSRMDLSQKVEILTIDLDDIHEGNFKLSYLIYGGRIPFKISRPDLEKLRKIQAHVIQTMDINAKVHDSHFAPDPIVTFPDDLETLLIYTTIKRQLRLTCQVIDAEELIYYLFIYICFTYLSKTNSFAVLLSILWYGLQKFPLFRSLQYKACFQVFAKANEDVFMIKWKSFAFVASFFVLTTYYDNSLLITIALVCEVLPYACEFLKKWGFVEEFRESYDQALKVFYFVLYIMIIASAWQTKIDTIFVATLLCKSFFYKGVFFLMQYGIHLLYYQVLCRFSSEEKVDAFFHRNVDRILAVFAEYFKRILVVVVVAFLVFAVTTIWSEYYFDMADNLEYILNNTERPNMTISPEVVEVGERIAEDPFKMPDT